MPYDAAIPELWHAALVEAYRNKHVYAGLCNRNYEGEIKGPGDVVRMMTLSDPTRRTYTKNTTSITSAEYLNVADQTLVIDQSFYWNVAIDDIDKIQTKPKMRDGLIDGIAFSLAEGLDDNIAAFMLAQGDGFTTAGGAGNRLADTTIVTTDENAYTVLVDLAVVLDVDNVPSEGRWVVVPPWFKGSMQKDARFVEYGTPGNMATLRSGRIATAAGFDIYVSNNVPSTATTLAFVIAGVDAAVTLAEQIPEGGLEFYRPPDRFADAIKVLHLFGRAPVRPSALAAVMAENG